MTAAASMLPGTPEAGSVDSLTELADTVGVEADWRDWQAGVVRRALDLLSGDGESIEATRERLTEIAARSDELGAACAATRDVVRSYAGQLADIQSRARALREAGAEAVARATRFRAIVLAGEPGLGRPPWQAPPSRRRLKDQQLAWELEQWIDAVADHGDVTRSWAELVAQRAELDDDTVSRLDGLPELATMRSRVPASGGAEVAAVAAALWSGIGAIVSAADLAALGSADAVRAVWDQLTDVQRRALISNEPLVTGNLDGIPIQFRAEANRLTMQAEIARIDRQLADTSVPAYLFEGIYGYTIEDLTKLRASYESYLYAPRTVFDEAGNKVAVVGTPVVVFDPAAGAIATYHGQFDAAGDVPAWAANVVVHVPGTGTSLLQFSDTNRRVGDMYRAASDLIAHPGAGSTALFAWAGGRFPQGAEAASASFSRDLAPRLRNFAAAVDRHPRASTLTVTGHSYGAAIVGSSEACGLRADRVLYVAGAGIGNDNTAVANFPHTGDVPHYALLARNDAIVGYIQGADVGSIGHGASPVRDPDVVRIETGFIDVDQPFTGRDIESLGGSAAHSGVYNVGSTAFENIVQTLVGGRVETYAESIRVLSTHHDGSRLVDGIDHPDYVARYADVK